MNLVKLQHAFDAAVSSWEGCDWDVEFGPSSLRLKGLRCSHALRLARATAGDESKCWYEAAAWLQEVEQDALLARQSGTKAIEAIRMGLIEPAVKYAEAASLYERKYTRCAAWCQFYEVLQKELMSLENGVQGQ